MVDSNIAARKPFRVAAVGCGNMMRYGHLRTMARSDLLEVVLACDRDVDTARAIQQDFNVPDICTDWRDVVSTADGIDIAILATHTNLRGEFIVPALEAGIPVYTEKPLAATSREARRIVDASARTNVPVCVGYNRRSAPAVLEMQRLLQIARAQGTDTFGIIDRNTGIRTPLPEESRMQTLLRVNDDLRTWKPWIFDDDQGIMFAEMVHFIDLAILLHAPAPVVRVYAEGSPRGNFVQVLTFADGSLSTIRHSCVSNFDAPKELIEITCRYVTIENDNHVEVRQAGLSREPAAFYFPCAFGTGYTRGKQGIAGFREAVAACRADMDSSDPKGARVPFPDKGHLRHLERFALHTAGQGRNPCSASTAIVVNNVALQLLESVRRGIPLAVDPDGEDPA